MICFCPGLVFCIFSAFLTQMIKFTTAIATLFCACIQFLYRAIVDAYQARRNDDLPDDTFQVAATAAGPNVSEPLLVPGLFLVRSDLSDRLTFSAPPETAQLCDQPGSNVGGNYKCTPNSNIQPVTKMLTFHTNTLDNSLPTAPNFMPSLQPRTPTFTRMFRRN